MHMQQGHTGAAGRAAQRRITQQRGLHARATKPLHAVAGRADHQQGLRVWRAVQHHVHRQRFTVLAQQWVDVAVDIQVGGLGGSQKLGACLCVGLREVVDHQRGVFSHVSASRTQAVAPSGIRSSLKS